MAFLVEDKCDDDFSIAQDSGAPSAHVGWSQSSGGVEIAIGVSTLSSSAHTSLHAHGREHGASLQHAATGVLLQKGIIIFFCCFLRPRDATSLRGCCLHFRLSPSLSEGRGDLRLKGSTLALLDLGQSVGWKA